MTDPTDQTQPIAKRVVLAIAARCRRILKAQDFRTDMGQKVLLGRPTLDVEELPALLVYSAQEEGKQERGQFTFMTNLLAVFLEGQATWDGVDESQPELVAQDMVADLKRAVLLQGDQTLLAETGQNLARFVRYAGRVIGYPRDGSLAVSARVRVDVEYREKYGHPSEPV